MLQVLCMQASMVTHVSPTITSFGPMTLPMPVTTKGGQLFTCSAYDMTSWQTDVQCT